MNDTPKNITILSLPNVSIDTASQTFATEIGSQPGVLYGVVFPDSYTKDKYLTASYKTTIPSSCAIASQTDHLYPQFRSRGIHCGMIAIALPIAEHDVTQAFYHQLERQLLYHPLYYLNYRLRLPFIRGKYDLDQKLFRAVLERGAEALIEYLQVDRATVERLEFGADTEPIDIAAVEPLLNPQWFHRRTVRLRYAFGRYFRGNHFFEVQSVTKPSEQIPELSEEQVVCMAHTGCLSAEDLVRVDLRDQYIRQSNYQSVAPDTEIYQSFMLAQQLIIRLISAYRLTTYALVRDAFQQAYGSHIGSPSIVVERGHNRVETSVCDGEPCFVYRHNAEKIKPDHYAIVSGDRHNNSYIVVGGANTAQYLNSVDHGLGKLLERTREQAVDTDDVVQIVRASRGINLPPTIKRSKETRVANLVADAYFSFMKEKGLICDHVSLKPLYNLKYT